AERERVAEATAALAAERARAGKAESARRAELAALAAARDRLRPAPAAGVGGSEGLIAELGRAADRLRQDAAQAAPAPRPGAFARLARRLRAR
ncbi:MAG: glycosyltransferase family 2 protein, partial [Solirubrobacteraceae bacterium]